jgi:succinate-acetate transporter protein
MAATTFARVATMLNRSKSRLHLVLENLMTEQSTLEGVPRTADESTVGLGNLGPPGLRIMLRPMASPMPLGFYTVAIATVMVSALQLGIIPAGDRNEVALLIVPAFALQLIVGIACIAGRDAIAATLMSSFAGTWLADSLFYLFGQPGRSSAEAVFFFTFTVFVVMLAVVARPKAALFAVLVVAVPRFFVSGLAAATGNADVSKAAGAIGFVLAAVAMYTAFALLLEDVRGHTVLPVGRSGPAREAIEGPIDSQLRGY